MLKKRKQIVFAKNVYSYEQVQAMSDIEINEALTVKFCEELGIISPNEDGSMELFPYGIAGSVTFDYLYDDKLVRNEAEQQGVRITTDANNWQRASWFGSRDNPVWITSHGFKNGGVNLNRALCEVLLRIDLSNKDCSH